MTCENIGKTVTQRVAKLRHHALAVLLLLPLGGCIASYSTRHEETALPAPDAAQVCRYNWSFAEPQFRADSLYSYAWAPASDFGHHLSPAIHALPAGCPAAAGPGRIDAKISAYFIRYANAGVRAAALLPAAYLTGFTLGFLPIPRTDHLAVCLEITAQDGLLHAAIAKGGLTMVTNVWGTSNHRYNQGRENDKVHLHQAMRELTVHAWNKAWAPARAEDQPIDDCRKAIDALLNPDEPVSAQ